MLLLMTEHCFVVVLLIITNSPRAANCRFSSSLLQPSGGVSADIFIELFKDNCTCLEVDVKAIGAGVGVVVVVVIAAVMLLK